MPPPGVGQQLLQLLPNSDTAAAVRRIGASVANS